MADPQLIEQAEADPTTAVGAEPISSIKSKSPAQIAWDRLRRDALAMICAAIVVFFIVIAVFAPLICKIIGVDPNTTNFDLIDQYGFPTILQTRAHPFGIEPGIGRDLLARWLYGARPSLLIAFSATILSTLIGTLLGITAGFIGGTIDRVISWIVDFFLSLPVLLLVIAISPIVASHFAADSVTLSRVRLWTLVGIFGVFGWTGLARLIRAQVLSLREREFVLAARAIGVPSQPHHPARAAAQRHRSDHRVHVALAARLRRQRGRPVVPRHRPGRAHRVLGSHARRGHPLLPELPHLFLVPGARNPVPGALAEPSRRRDPGRIRPQDAAMTNPIVSHHAPVKTPASIPSRVGERSMRKKGLAAAVVVLALGAAACGGKSPSQTASATNGASATASSAGQSQETFQVVEDPTATGPAPAVAGSQQGGTVTLLTAVVPTKFDPTQAYYVDALAVLRTVTRGMVEMSLQSDGKYHMTPDLGTDLGQHNADFTEWTFHLKKGMKYEDGTEIKAQDFAYAIERSFAQTELPGGPTYQITYFKDGDKYKGPYADKTPYDGVSTPDDYTLVMKMSKPFADLPYYMTFPVFSPIPQAKDTKSNYGLHPLASGPYKFGKYTPGKELTLVKNAQWDAASDPGRTSSSTSTTSSSAWTRSRCRTA